MGTALFCQIGASLRFSTENSFSRAAMSVAMSGCGHGRISNPGTHEAVEFERLSDRSSEGAERIHRERTRQVTTPWRTASDSGIGLDGLGGIKDGLGRW
jgi:hypothetical protein